MPLYLRKSVRAGPFRFNLSNSGVGMSVGVRGLRVGTGPRGHYISAGLGCIRYRATIGHAGERRTLHSHAAVSQGENSRFSRRSGQPATYQASGVEMVEVASGDVMGMRDEAFSSVLDEINAKQNRARLSVVLLCSLIIAGIGLAFLVGQAGLVLVALAFPAWAVGKWLDTYRRATVMLYDLEEGAQRAFEGMTEGFDALRRCAGQWHVEAGGVVRDTTTWKRNAGASHIVRRKPATLSYRLPKVVRSNVTPPTLQLGSRTVYFFPDVALIQTGNRFGAVGYADLHLRRQPSQFIEDGRVPKDARIVSYVWQHPNKKGGPDRRFRSNRQLPVCLYDALHIGSASGVNELTEFSQPEASASFASALLRMPRQSASDLTALSPAPSPRAIGRGPVQPEDAKVSPHAPEDAPSQTEPKRGKGRRILASVCLVAACGGGAALIVGGRHTVPERTVPPTPVALAPQSAAPKAPDADVTGSVRAAATAPPRVVKTAPPTPAKPQKHSDRQRPKE